MKVNTTSTILLVEDNRDDEELTLIALRDSGVKSKVVVTRDGEEARDYLSGTGKYLGRSKDSDPALVLLDLKLPKIDGLELLRWMRGDSRTRYTPVVVLTTSNEDRDLVDSYNFGANSYVRKPVDFVQFTEAVKQLSLYWLVINEAPAGWEGL